MLNWRNIRPDRWISGSKLLEPVRTIDQVCAAVKADPALRDVPVILVTARAQRADLQAGQEAGADAYLIKPFSPMELLERVTAMLGN